MATPARGRLRKGAGGGPPKVPSLIDVSHRHLAGIARALARDLVLALDTFPAELRDDITAAVRALDTFVARVAPRDSC